MVNTMDFTKATDQQLTIIIENDKDIPSSLLEGVVIEMIKRNLWDGIIMYAAKQVYNNLPFILEQRLKIDRQELIHIGHIEISTQMKRFKKGMRTPKTFFIMCLMGKFRKMIRDVEAEKRYSNIGTKPIDHLDEKIQEKIFQSPVNVERHVINKLTIQEVWPVLREVEQQAIIRELQGYTQYEIAESLGMNKTYGNILLKKAYQKLKKALVNYEPKQAI